MKRMFMIYSLIAILLIAATGCTTVYAPSTPNDSTENATRRTATYCAVFTISDRGVHFAPTEDTYTLLGITAQDIENEKVRCESAGKKFAMSLEAKMCVGNKTVIHTKAIQEAEQISPILWLNRNDFWDNDIDVKYQLRKLVVQYEITLSYGEKTATFQTIYVSAESENPQHPGDYSIHDLRPQIV